MQSSRTKLMKPVARAWLFRFRYSLDDASNAPGTNSTFNKVIFVYITQLTQGDISMTNIRTSDNAILHNRLEPVTASSNAQYLSLTPHLRFFLSPCARHSHLRSSGTQRHVGRDYAIGCNSRASPRPPVLALWLAVSTPAPGLPTPADAPPNIRQPGQENGDSRTFVLNRLYDDDFRVRRSLRDLLRTGDEDELQTEEARSPSNKI